MNPRTAHHPVKITVLTPVHIGSGEYYSPTNSYIHPNQFNKEDVSLRMFSPAKLNSLMATETFQSKFNRIFSDDEPDLGELYRLFKGNWHKLAGDGPPQVKIHPRIQNFVEARMKKQEGNRQNQKGGKRDSQGNLLNIERNFHNPVNGKVLIPGSSLKGAIRTALLNEGGREAKKKISLEEEFKRNPRWFLDREKKSQKRSGLNHFLQKTALDYDGNVINDPLKQFSIADTRAVPNANGACEILFKRTFHKRPQNHKEGEGDLKDLLECLTAGTELVSNLSFSKKSQNFKRGNQWIIKDCDYSPSFQIVKNHCNAFYSRIFRNELKLLKNGELNWAASPNCKKILDRLEHHCANGFLLRVGRHSGAESMTMDNFRKIEIKLKEAEKQRLNRNSNWENQPRTLSLASQSEKGMSDAVPFGWVWVEEIHD